MNRPAACLRYVAAVVVTGLVGCGASPGRVTSGPAVVAPLHPGLTAAPRQLKRACTAAAAGDGQRVPCPQLVPIPAARTDIGQQLQVLNVDKRPGKCQTLLEFEYRRVVQKHAFHLLLGTRCRAFGLRTSHGYWPARRQVLNDDLGLIGSTPEIPGKPGVGGKPVSLKLLETLRLRGTHALLLRARDYPAGGVHGGHLIVLWNEGGRGYVVSPHFLIGHGRRDLAAAIAMTLGTARSVTLVGPAVG